MKRILYLILIFNLFFISPGKAQEENSTLLTTLDNGLEVIIIEKNTAPLVSLKLFVKTGSMYEEEWLGAGLSHILEHIVAGGSTHKRTEEESQQILDDIGGASNAYTTRDHTCYYITTTDEHWLTGLDLLTDWVFNAQINDEEYNREMGVIEREIEKDENDPRRQISLLADQLLFRSHPARYPVIGYKKCFLTVTKNDVVNYYRNRYVSNNMLLVVVGKVNKEEVLTKIKELVSPYARKSLKPILLPYEPPPISPRRIEKESPLVKTAYLILNFRTIPLSHPDLYALDVLAGLLGEGGSSRLAKTVKRAKQLTHNISCWSYTPGYDGGEFAIYAETNPEQVKDLEIAIWEEIEKIKQDKIEKKELEKTKKQIKVNYVFNNEKIEHISSTVGRNYLITGDPFFYKNYTEQISRVTAKEIKQVANKYLRKEFACTSILTPVKNSQENKEKPRDIEKAQSFLTEVKVKKITEEGPIVLYQKENESPLVAVKFYFKGGVISESELPAGMFNFLVHCLFSGTKHKTQPEIAKLIDTMGLELRPFSGFNTFGLEARLLAEDFAEAMGLIFELIEEASFPEEEIEKTRSLTLGQLTQKADDWFYEARKLFHQKLYPQHPYGHLPDGEVESVKGITREQLIGVWKKYCTRNNLTISICGNVSETEVDRVLAKNINKLPAGNIELELPPSAPKLSKTLKELTPTERSLSTVFIGFPGITAENKEDRIVLEVIDAMLSGINYPGGWLHKELRGQELVYVVHAYNWMGFAPGAFIIYAACEPSKVDQVIEIVLKNIAKLKAGDFEEQEIQQAKTICINMHKMNLETSADRAASVALDYIYGLGTDFSNQYTDLINKVSSEAIISVANKYFTNYLVSITQGKQSNSDEK